ncbi:hypothetical protein [Nocardioides sp. GY 10113]|uniref:hypothetical protein n=1 Tax=Nocardioides sp. GY 10113 TaxID=2569761 RepID=UPI0014590DF7|nr:hypothetical protein [Nocardioides sp. GY 10113]
MSLVAGPQTRPSERGAVPRHVVTSLARSEVRRMLLNPWLVVGTVISALTYREWAQPESWSGERYGSWFIPLGGLLLATSAITAGAFHRERVEVAAAAPAGEQVRFRARLLAATGLILPVLAGTAVMTLVVAAQGGLSLGYEPGRTAAAVPTPPEYLQGVLAAVVAIGIGAAVGRRFRHRITATLVLILIWSSAVGAYWVFQAAATAPFALLQSQPVSVEVGGPAADPASFPAGWLLEGPGEYQDHWARLVVSPALAAGHDVYLIGLAALLLAVAAPRGRDRRLLLAAGAAIAVAGYVAQLAVYP